MLIQPEEYSSAEQQFLVDDNICKVDWFSPRLDPCAAAGRNPSTLRKKCGANMIDFLCIRQQKH